MAEKKIFQKLRNLNTASVEQGTKNLDDDVENERKRVIQNANDSDKRDVLTVIDLQKHYQKVKAVDGINFGVQFGECFGFLGVNGAGKTTSFK